MSSQRGNWQSRLGFILAAVGSAIGLGNIWRFSYMAYKNGGGAFLIPYFLGLILIGIPVMILEFGIGHKARGSAPKAMRRAGRFWEWLGWWPVIFVMFGIVLYYTVIIGWCTNYLVYSFNLSWEKPFTITEIKNDKVIRTTYNQNIGKDKTKIDTNSFFFKKFLKLKAKFWPIEDVNMKIVVAVFLIWFINWLIVYRGISGGIELANKIFMPLLLVFTIILVIFAINLPGSSVGLEKYLKPDWNALKNPQVWIDGFSQIFFTLSVGFGIMIAYASYLPRKNANLVSSAFITGILNNAFSIFSGFAVFSVLGYMAYSQHIPFSDVVDKSIGLAFVVYPKAISLMPYFRVGFGVLFFLSLVIAGISSSVSILEAFAAALIDKFNFKREILISFLCIIGFFLSLLFTTGNGLLYLDVIDHFISTYGLIGVGILELLILGYLYKAERLQRYINKVSKWKVGNLWIFTIKYLSPAILLISLGQAIYMDFINYNTPKNIYFKIGKLVYVMRTDQKKASQLLAKIKDFEKENHVLGKLKIGLLKQYFNNYQQIVTATKDFVKKEKLTTKEEKELEKRLYTAYSDYKLRKEIISYLRSKFKKIKTFPEFIKKIKGLFLDEDSLATIKEIAKQPTAPYGGYSWAPIWAIGTQWLLVTLVAAFAVTSVKWKRNRNG